MENEILENGTTPETEVVQETETVVTETAATETKGNKITEALGKAADKGKELAENPKALWEKIKSVPKKIWIGIGAGVAAILALIIVLSIVTNTYKTPIKLMQAEANNKKASAMMNKQVAQLNGFCEKEYKAISKIMKKSENYDDQLEAFEEEIEANKERYGDDYKFKYKVVEKEKIDKDDLKDFQKELRSGGKAMLNNYDDLDSDDYETLADVLGLTKAQAKKLVKEQISIAKTLKTAKVTAGYELTVEVTITGSEVEDEEPIERTINVYKVNGRWVSQSAIYGLG